VKAKTKPGTAPRRIADCGPGDIVKTPAGYLRVAEQVKNGTLVELWHPDEQRRLSAIFGVMNDLAVLTVTPKPARPQTMGGGSHYDPLRGREIA
jgi:hypothetical protein